MLDQQQLDMQRSDKGMGAQSIASEGLNPSHFGWSGLNQSGGIEC